MAFEIPARATTVTIKFDLILAADATSGTAQPVTSEAIVRAPTSARLSPGTPTQPSNRPTLSQNKFEIGGGRDLPPLLFLTDLVKLGEHITPNVVATIIDAIGRGGHRVCDVANVGASTVDDIAAALRARIDERPPAQVVILGGYDVIPSAQVESIPPETSASMKQIVRAADPDGFVVWSDDSYVDIDGDWLPEIPVSRVPDCHDALFTLKALQAEPAATKVRSGIRNSAREFVIEIFDTLPGATSLLVSGPTDSRSLTPGELDGSHFYCMLHGSDSDATRFWGEWPTGNCVEAVTLGHLPTSDVDFAVLGCCWGALPASTKAADWKPGQPIVGRLAGQSIALTLLAAGARGVFGCTGAHWSPTKPPYDTASGPFHRALWRSILACNSPAAALLEAKYDFSSRLTTLTDANDLAIAYKTLAQFTCLGLGC
ncbi:hypothetical protein A5678_04210 [Mycobacterium sp. E2733]|nr:hypothetical protein A5678_04210 [Mycobacterium sp. E2733]